jgi:DNA-binding LacI/PurR family transcriptional regulator
VPKLSVILRPVADIGRAAGRLTLSRMANPDLPARVEMVTTQFLDRQSVAAPGRSRAT